MVLYNGNSIDSLDSLRHQRFCENIGVRGGGQGGQLPPPIRAVCGHEFGQRGDIIRAKHNTCLKNLNLLQLTEKTTNLGSDAAVNGKNSATPQNMDPGKCLLLPPPPQKMDPGKFLLLPPPPPTESIRAKLGLPPPPPNGCWPVRACVRRSHQSRLMFIHECYHQTSGAAIYHRLREYLQVQE